MAASAESRSFHAQHKSVSNSNGNQMIYAQREFWLGEYDASENSMDVFWGTQKIGSLGLTAPKQGVGATWCSVWVENDGYTTDSIEDAVLYMARNYCEPENTEEPEVIGHSQVVEGLPQEIREVIANISAIECSELEDAIIVARRAIDDVSPDVAEYLDGGNFLQVIEEIQARTFTFDDVRTSIQDLQAHSGRD